MLATTPKRGCRQLRRGRWSSPNKVYHVTFVTLNRSPSFSDFGRARKMVRAIRNSASDAETLAFVVMPDHVHWLLQLLGGKSLGQVVGRAKAEVSRCRSERGHRVKWQDGFHDHAIRRDEDIQHIARYIVANPVRAGLVKSVRDYPHWDATWL